MIDAATGLDRDPHTEPALASYHRGQFLLTWNCAHLANANKQEHIRYVNARLGLHVPILTTPLELIQEPEEYE